jgi:iron-sulfur cluster assembly accessory protein
MKMFDITDKAKTQMEGLLSKNPGKYAVSLSVLGGGCAGFKYDWGFTNKDAIGKDDILEDWGTGRFVVDESSLLYVTGTQIDYKEEVFGSQFEITNPNSKSSCGCGESFGV